MAGSSDAIPNSLPGKDRCAPRLFMWTAKIAVPKSTAALNANSHVVCTYYSSHRCMLAQWLCIIVLVDSIHLLKLWATIKYLGRSRMENLIDMHLDLTAQTQAAIEAEPDLVLLNQKSTYYSGHSTHSKLCSNHNLNQSFAILSCSPASFVSPFNSTGAGSGAMLRRNSPVDLARSTLRNSACKRCITSAVLGSVLPAAVAIAFSEPLALWPVAAKKCRAAPSGNVACCGPTRPVVGAK